MTDPAPLPQGGPPERRLRGRVAAVYLLRVDGAAVLQLRDDRPEIPHRGMWVPPGGHCLDDEPLEECGRREFREETGYELGELRFLTRFIDDHVEGFDPLDLAVFWATYDGRQEITCFEGQSLEFVARADAERLGVPVYLRTLWDAALAARGR